MRSWTSISKERGSRDFSDSIAGTCSSSSGLIGDGSIDTLDMVLSNEFLDDSMTGLAGRDSSGDVPFLLFCLLLPLLLLSSQGLSPSFL